MDFQIAGKCALVTGGSHGIGRAVALTLAAEGCNVAICARGKENLELSREMISHKGVECLALEADVMKKVALDAAFSHIVNRWGNIDILINNVGGGGRWGHKDVEETSSVVWEEVLYKNFIVAKDLTLRCIPLMREAGWGRVISITSIYGKIGGGRAWFNVAKCAQTTLMKNFAMNKDLARLGITFNSVAPGDIMIPDTGWEAEANRDPDAFADMLDKNYPLGRMGKPEDVAGIVAFLCSNQASYVNGASILVDGAQTSYV